MGGAAVYREGPGWRCDFASPTGPRSIPIIGEIARSNHPAIIEHVRQLGGDSEAMRAALSNA